MGRSWILSMGLLSLVLPAVVHADRVHLTSGAVLEGRATVRGQRVVLEVEGGSLTLSTDQVRHIERTTTPLDELERRMQRLAEGDVKALLRLAEFCRAHQLGTSERELLRRVIALRPNHSAARARLGYVRDGAGWVTREDARRAQGEREHAGSRPSPQQQVRLLEAQRQLEEARADRVRAEHAREAERRAQIAHEAERARERGSAAVPGASWFVPVHAGTGPRPRHGAAAAPVFINGVRAPGDTSFSLPGVRDPKSYF